MLFKSHTLKYILSIFTAAIILWSCQKEFTNEPPPPSGFTGDTTLLMKYIELDTTVAAPNDTLSKFLFYYDNLRRLTKVDYITYNNGIIVPADSYYHSYLYNGTDTLPYKEIENGTDPFNGTPYTNNRFYTYTNGRLMYDSTAGTDFRIINKYSYSGNRIVDSTLFYDNTMTLQSMNYKIVNSQIVNGRPLSQKDTVIYNAGNFPVPEDTTFNNYIFSYDTKPNPLHKFKYLTPFYDITEYPALNSWEANNFTELQQTQTNPSGQYNYNFRYQYQYRLDGYPVSAVITDLNIPAQYVKVLLYYNN